MTCIAALKHKDKIYMACDSAVTAGDNLLITGNDKIALLDVPCGDGYERLMIGSSGDLRILNLISVFQPPARTCPSEQYLIGDFSRAFHTFLENNGALRQSNGADNISFYTLIAFNGKIYSWSVDFGLLECVEGFEVEGSGVSARGVLWALKDMRMSAERKLGRVMEYAANYCEGVRPPFKMFCLS